MTDRDTWLDIGLSLVLFVCAFGLLEIMIEVMG